LIVGDSIAHGYPSTLWTDAQILNVGVCGLEAWEALQSLKGWSSRRFDRMIVIVGINDVLRRIKGMLDRSDADILLSIEAIVNTPLANDVLVVSLLPVSEHAKYVPAEQLRDINQTIVAFNGRLNECVEACGACYVDAHSALCQNHSMNPLATTDGIHLSQTGYEWLHQAISASWTRQNQTKSSKV
jgi:lysophospholipase L1-like esterase